MAAGRWESRAADGYASRHSDMHARRKHRQRDACDIAFIGGPTIGTGGRLPCMCAPRRAVCIFSTQQARPGDKTYCCLRVAERLAFAGRVIGRTSAATIGNMDLSLTWPLKPRAAAACRDLLPGRCLRLLADTPPVVAGRARRWSTRTGAAALPTRADAHRLPLSSLKQHSIPGRGTGEHFHTVFENAP